MVLELLINPKKMVNRPLRLFAIGAVYSFLSVLLGVWIFNGYASLIMITLTTIAVMPFIHKIFVSEEMKEIKIKGRRKLLKEHSKAISMFVWLFLGFLATFTLLFIFLSGSTLENVFGAQIETITSVEKVENGATGDFISSFSAIGDVFLNNLKVLFFCVVFSIFFGAGAIFILTWNASVMGAAIGAYIKGGLAKTIGLSGHVSLTSIGLLQYMLHGIPEIVAYFIGALASGIIAYAFVNQDLKGKKFRKLMKNSLNMILIAIVILFLAALVEIFITPLVV